MRPAERRLSKRPVGHLWEPGRKFPSERRAVRGSMSRAGRPRSAWRAGGPRPGCDGSGGTARHTRAVPKRREVPAEEDPAPGRPPAADSAPARRPLNRDLRKALSREAASRASDRAYGSPDPRSAERRTPRANRADGGLAQPCGNGRRERGTGSGGVARTGKHRHFPRPRRGVRCGLPRQ